MRLGLSLGYAQGLMSARGVDIQGSLLGAFLGVQSSQHVEVPVPVSWPLSCFAARCPLASIVALHEAFTQDTM